MKLLSFQREAMRRQKAGFLILFWRRQAGKTTTLGATALKTMADFPGILVTYCSASILLGRELVLKEATLWYDMLNDFRLRSAGEGPRLDAMDGPKKIDSNQLDDLAGAFEKSRLEVRLWHSRTKFSRTQVIAPNPATARSFSGWVIIDEIGFIRDFKDLWEAMEPIASRDPSFLVRMATTPPNDDAHFSYELTIPPEGVSFSPDPTGHWYTSQAGVLCHRVDVYDALAAGVKLFDTNTRQEVTPAQHRAAQLDRDAWDRNYALLHKPGGAAAVSLQAIHQAMLLGKDLGCLAAEDDFPSDWRARIGPGPIAIGYDPATTEKEKSNPAAMAIVETVGHLLVPRLIIRFKSADPEKHKLFLREACDLGAGRRPRRLCIDATSERFYAAQVKREFSPICPVELVVSSESTSYMGSTMSVKAYLGNLLVNAIDDGRVPLPSVSWIKDDFRLVRREKGSFDTSADSAGNHGDTFDAVKLAAHGLLSRGGPVEAAAAQVGSYGRPPPAPVSRLRPRPDLDVQHAESAATMV